MRCGSSWPRPGPDPLGPTNSGSSALNPRDDLVAAMVLGQAITKPRHDLSDRDSRHILSILEIDLGNFKLNAGSLDLIHGRFITT
jgi:hypothetical protein